MNSRRIGSRTPLVLLLVTALFGFAAPPARADHQRLTLTPGNAVNTAGDRHCVTATYRAHNPIVGVPVHFSVTGANPTPADVVLLTGSDGRVDFCYVGTRAGNDLIFAFADVNRNGQENDGEPSATARKTYRAGPPAAVTLDPAAAVNPAGQTHCVTATVADRFGNPVGAGFSVVFAVTGANARTPVATSTNSAGRATFCYTGQTAGADEITAYVDLDNDRSRDLGEPIGVATKAYHPGAPATVTLAPPAATNRAGEEHCVTATVTDLFGNRAGSGMPVIFSVTGTNARAATTRSTNSSGEATFCYTGTRVGPDLITAFADANRNARQDLGEPTGTATKAYLPGNPASVVVTPPASENTVGTGHCVSATVSDLFGNPTPGVTVRFSVTGANTATGTDTTDANGTAGFCYTGRRSGPDTISAHADSDRDGALDAGEPVGAATKLYHPGVPATLTLDPAVATNTVGEEHCVTATAHDEFGNLVGSGNRIVFSVLGSNPRGPAFRTTNNRGQATFCYTGTKAGEDAIRAYADNNESGTQDLGEPSGAAAKTYLPGPPTTLVLSPKVAVNTVDAEHCVTATTADAFGNPTPGVSVRFSVRGAVTTSGSVSTNTAGTARFCYDGPAFPGEDAITAFADTNRSGSHDAGEPVDGATKTWILPVSTPGCLVSIDPDYDHSHVHEGGLIRTVAGTRGKFAGHADDKSGHWQGHQAYRDETLNVNVRSLEILAVVCTPDRKEATIYGRGLEQVTQTELLYRIRVRDDARTPSENNPSNSPLARDKYGILLSTGYFSGDQPLESGNIAIASS